MPNPRYQTRLHQDNADRVDQYVEEHDVSQSEAVRRLIREGLDAVEEDERETDEEEAEPLAEASINQTVRILGGLGIALALLFFVLVRLGVL